MTNRAQAVADRAAQWAEENGLAGEPASDAANEWSAWCDKVAETSGANDSGTHELTQSLWALSRPADDADELLKDRYLCRGGGLLLVGPTGIGKSSLSM